MLLTATCDWLCRTCVLFADISGFTALCEAMEAKGMGVSVPVALSLLRCEPLR